MAEAAVRPSFPLHARFALVAAALAGVAVFGWLTGAQALTTFADGRPSLSPMTALVFFIGAGAVSALRARRGLAAGLAALQCACGLAIVAAQWLQLPHAQLLPAQWWSSKFTGVAFAVSGAAAFLLAKGRVAAGQVIAFIVLLFSGLMALGHIVPSADLYASMPGTGVAIPTVLAFGALSLGQLLSFGATGVSGALSSRNAAGKAGRRLLLVGLGTAVLLAVLDVLALRHGLFDAETAVLLLAWMTMALLGVTLWGLAVAVERAERARVIAEHERNQVRQMVAAAITHDLRSPLQAAVLSDQILQRLVSEPAALAAVERLQRSHRRIDRLLRSLLDSLALGGGQPLSLRASFFALRGLVQEVVAENEAVLADRVAADGAAQGWWDRDALFRVVENLLLNAVKYGKPEVPICCSIVGEGEWVLLAVRNEGAPIPESSWESIFEPFRRGEETRDEKIGWGVGLAYARAVAASHGGTVRVAQSDAGGTTFELRLPVDSRERLALPPAAP